MFIGNIFSILYFFAVAIVIVIINVTFIQLFCDARVTWLYIFSTFIRWKVIFILFFSFLHDLFYDFIIFLFVFCCCFSLLCFEWHDVITNMDTLVFVSLFTKKKYRQFISFFRYFFLFFFLSLFMS